MSIYATILTIGDEHLPRCARLKKIGRKVYEQDDSKPCTCGAAPIVYQHSGVLPSDRDVRDGCFMLGAIPGHITRNGRDNGPENGWHPWLRLSIFGVKSDSLVLTRKQAEKLRDSLTEWLKSS